MNSEQHLNAILPKPRATYDGTLTLRINGETLDRVKEISAYCGLKPTEFTRYMIEQALPVYLAAMERDQIEKRRGETPKKAKAKKASDPTTESPTEQASLFGVSETSELVEAQEPADSADKVEPSGTAGA